MGIICTHREAFIIHFDVWPVPKWRSGRESMLEMVPSKAQGTTRGQCNGQCNRRISESTKWLFYLKSD